MKNTKNVVHRLSKIVQKHNFVKDILQAIINQSGKVLLVGGAVRDLLLDQDAKDLDFEVYGLTLEQLQKILEQFGPVSFVGKSFGVLRLHGVDVDWSLPRKDSSGRHPVVAYDPFMSYQQAFIRRDLTINAMGIDMQTFELIDPFGGMQDLQAKILRAPDLDFFQQDPLRLLRVMQFVARFQMSVDEKLSEFCAQMDISTLSIERVEQEFKKLFIQGVRPSKGLQWLVQIGKFDQFFGPLVLTDQVSKQLDFAAKLSYATEYQKWMMMMALMCNAVQLTPEKIEIKKIDRQFAQQLKIFLQPITVQVTLIEQVGLLVWYAQVFLQNDLSDSQIKWLAYWLAPQLSVRLLMQFCLLIDKHFDAALYAQKAYQLQVLDHPEEPLLTGKDLLDIAQGPVLGKLVERAYQVQIDQKIVDKKQLKSLFLIEK
ncbi:MAG: CCA tRNA nucleotidyltransferase [Candidatus Chromulinivorax sp.]